MLIGAFRNAYALKPHGMTGIVHHGEHVFQATVGLAHQITNRPGPFAVGHHGRRAGMNAKLVFNRDALDIIALAQ